MVTRIVWGLLLGIAFLFLCMQSAMWVVLLLGVIHIVAQFEYSSLYTAPTAALRNWHLGISTVLFFCFALGLMGEWPLEPAVTLLVAVGCLYALPLLGAYERDPAGGYHAYFALLRSLLLITLPLALIAAIIRWPDGAGVDSWLPGTPWFLLLIGASWGADTGAIFAGKLAGRTQISPRISPKKTMEGVVGGALAAGLIWACVPLLFAVEFKQWTAPQDNALLIPLLGLAGMLLGLVSVFGDLLFSLFKREAGVKDYGALIPGHGGLLDRFDSMLFIAPFVYLLCWLS